MHGAHATTLIRALTLRVAGIHLMHSLSLASLAPPCLSSPISHGDTPPHPHHSATPLQMLAQKLQLTDEEAERWMVDMVRSASTSGTTADAKIDSSAKQVTPRPLGSLLNAF